MICQKIWNILIEFKTIFTSEEIMIFFSSIFVNYKWDKIAFKKGIIKKHRV